MRMPTLVHDFKRAMGLWAWVLLILLLPIAANAGGLNCELAKPPKQSGVTATDGYLFFVYPTKLANDYSGCQTMWDEFGRPYLVRVLEHGHLTVFEQKSHAKGETPVLCRYRNEHLIRGKADLCPKASEAYHFFLTLKEAEVPPISPGRDPRR
jgi:hypothetical protein